MNATMKKYFDADGFVNGVEITKEDGSVVIIGEVPKPKTDQTNLSEENQT